MKIFLSHLTTVRSINKLGPLNLHPLAYLLDGYLSPVNSSLGQVLKFLLTILVQTCLASASVVKFGGKSVVHVQTNFL